ncbi:tRNA1(Val) (adenine(37)-N6)-methyltransferase [Chryseobacterium sp. MP_3.2]|uniref:tRNA1(Val) (adenine(37)-N6)-methyltransferase n=1 Tax=Chryseobacterium sp. MP_3.2 TaxID=3071712 RepID=UPI002E036690|nr:tRNA1Val (adenine37-N6)-methyltransferase [Chryseobacterium sp. MP_3.2]
MKPFQFKNFSIAQSKNVFRVGTDGVLLGALSSVESAQNVLEVGTGTGLIGLMVAQRNAEANIVALDITKEAVSVASQNFSQSPYSDQLLALLSDFKEFETEMKFDLIISNPPYFEENPSLKDRIARQQTDLNFENLISKSAILLSKNGILSLIIPFEAGEVLYKIATENQLHLHRKVMIYGIKDSTPKRLILEFGLGEKEFEEQEFTIEKSPREYSDEYLELTKDFHIFKK